MGVEALRALSLDQLLECRLNAQDAFVVLTTLGQVLQDAPKDSGEVWRLVSKFVLQPDHPFEVHKLFHQATFRGWKGDALGPPPCWVPTHEGAKSTNAAKFMNSFQGDKLWEELHSGCPSKDFDLLQRISFQNPEAFWPHALNHLKIKFHQLPHRALQVHPTSPDASRWLPGARLNIAESCLWGRDPDRPAVVWAAEEQPETIHTITVGELSRRSAHIAAALRAAGMRPGDAVAIDMPMTAESVVIYLGIVLAGCVVVSIADSFAPAEILSRLRISQAVAIFTQDVILRGGKSLPLYKRVCAAQAPKAIVLPASPKRSLQAGRLRLGDLTWDDFLAAAPTPARLVAHVAHPNDTTNILFSSGTTGEPKAIPWTHVTPFRAGVDGFFNQDIREGDVVCWPTNLGWMMGPWLIYAALLNSATVALFQGSPLKREFGLFVERARVSMLGLVPSIAKVWRATGCMAGLDWSCLRCYSSTGEASAPDDSLWLCARAGYKPVLEYCGGTELGGAFLAGSMVQPQAPSCFSTPTMGCCPFIISAEGVLSCHGETTGVAGEFCLTAPMVGMSQRLLNKDHHEVYYAGMRQLPAAGWFLRRHGDEMERLPGGYYRARGRVDDTMNLGGIKVHCKSCPHLTTNHIFPAVFCARYMHQDSLESGVGVILDMHGVSALVTCAGFKCLQVSTVELEQACTGGVADILEAAAVACPPPGGGPDQLVLFLVPRPGAQKSVELLKGECQTAISKTLNPLFRVERVVVRPALPRTATNKVLRRVLRDELLPKAKL